MYLDTRGHVTTGIGHLIANTHQAAELEFLHLSSGKRATKSEIIKEFTRIRKLPYGQKYGAGFYKKHTGLILSDQAMFTMMEQHIESFENELWAIYGKTNFERLPDNVKLALFDMIFNLGMPKLKNTFVKFFVSDDKVLIILVSPMPLHFDQQIFKVSNGATVQVGEGETSRFPFNDFAGCVDLLYLL